MALVFDATVGGVSANSYVTVAEADAYFDARLNTSAWTALSTADKQRALAAATARLEQEEWIGTRVAPTLSRLKWPRSYVYDEDGYYYALTAIAWPIVAATCELALVMIVAGDADLFVPTGLEGFEHISIGSLSITPRQMAPIPGTLPPQVLRLLRRFLTTYSGLTRLVRSC